MAQWIVRTEGDYPHLLPHIVENVISKRQLNDHEMDWVVEMSDQEAEALRRRGFVASIELAQTSAHA